MLTTGSCSCPLEMLTLTNNHSDLLKVDVAQFFGLEFG